MNRTDFATFLHGFLKAAEFAADAVDEAHDWLMDWLAYAAAHGYLHVTTEEGRVTALSIGGPITSARLLAARHPEHLRPDALEDHGDVLFGMYLFVRPDARADGGGLACMTSLIDSARRAFPDCASYAYWRPSRGLTVRPLPPLQAPAETTMETPDGQHV